MIRHLFAGAIYTDGQDVSSLNLRETTWPSRGNPDGTCKMHGSVEKTGMGVALEKFSFNNVLAGNIVEELIEIHHHHR